MLMRERNLAIIEEEETINKKLENRVAKMSEEQDRLKGEQNRMIQVRAAYNADKRALTERIQELESVLRQRDFDKQELEAKVNLLEQSAGQYRNEINFWNGKCSTLRRDVEYQERHLQRYKDENTKLINECDYLRVRAENLEREVTLLRRQVSGLQEDNDRINRMYQVVEREAVFNAGGKQQENVPSNGNVSYRSHTAPEEKTTLRMNGGIGGGKWKVVEDDNFSYSGGPLFQNIPTVINPLGGPTMKRNEEAAHY